MYYKLGKVIINAPRLAKVIQNVVIQYYNFSDLIITNKNLFFIS